MHVFKAAVVGADTMGADIAQVIAAAGVPVILADTDRSRLEQGLERAEQVARAQLEALVAKQRLTAEEADARVREIVSMIEPAAGYEGLGDVDLAIEAVPDVLEVKQAVLAELDACVPGGAILASTTSALSISELAEAVTPMRRQNVVGLHFLHPASATRVVEVVAAEDTTVETLALASAFTQQIRKTAIRCFEAPGFVVNRIRGAAVCELWRVQEERELAIDAVDAAVTAGGLAPAGPFQLCDQLGLDTVTHLAEQLREAYGEGYYVHGGMRELVAGGELGARTGRGFYADGAPRVQGRGEADADELARRFALRALVAACHVLEAGLTGARELDLAMSAGAGMVPPPLARADAEGLDVVLAELERAAAEWGPQFAPPALLRRLVSQGRLGRSSGQGFFPYPQLDGDAPVKLERRGEIAVAWLDNPPANSISPATVEALRALWEELEDTRVLIFASANPQLFCAGADIKAFTQMQPADAGALARDMHALLLEFERSPVVTIAAVNGLALGGGCELAMACDMRIAARSASFGQPEINLGIIPGFGGTQRLARLVGAGPALEMNLTGAPIDSDVAWERGLVSDVVPDHELLDAALVLGRRLARQAPLAIAEIKRLQAAADLDSGLAAEQEAFARVFASEDARAGIGAFLGKREAVFRGR